MSKSCTNTLRLVRAPTRIVDPWKYYLYKSKYSKQVFVALVELVVSKLFIFTVCSSFWSGAHHYIVTGTHAY